MFKSLNLVKVVKPILKEEIRKIPDIQSPPYTEIPEGFVEKYVHQIFDSIANYFKGIIISALHFAGGVTLIIGSLSVVAMMCDTEDNLNFKKYSIGAIIVYIGLKCIEIMVN